MQAHDLQWILMITIDKILILCNCSAPFSMMTSHHLYQSLYWRYMHQQHWRGDGEIYLLFHPKSIVKYGLVLFQYGLTIVEYMGFVLSIHGLAIVKLWAYMGLGYL